MIVGSDEYHGFMMFILGLAVAFNGVIGLVGYTHIWITRRFTNHSIQLNGFQHRQEEMVSCHNISK